MPSFGADLPDEHKGASQDCEISRVARPINLLKHLRPPRSADEALRVGIPLAALLPHCLIG